MPDTAATRTASLDRKSPDRTASLDRVLVTGVGRSVGIGNAIATMLAADGWTVVTSGHVDDDARMTWGADPDGPPQPGVAHFEADLADPAAAEQLVDQATKTVGPLTGLVMCHCESVDASILTTTVDSFVIAAATELAHLGITANSINPGGTDTGWMTPEIVESCLERNIQPRVGMPQDCANLVRFLFSPEGRWINAQLLYSDGGLKPR